MIFKLIQEVPVVFLSGFLLRFSEVLMMKTMLHLLIDYAFADNQKNTCLPLKYDFAAIH